MICQEPLAYLLGLEGLALLAAFGGEYDQDFVAARIAEVRTLLDSPPLHAGVSVPLVSTVDGYRVWSASYDEPRKHQVIGTDSSPDMLARARTRVPTADFRLGDLTRLPVSDDSVDIAVCALALTHVPDLAPVFAEFAWVVRPGGHLVIADVHHALVELGSVPKVARADGGPALQPAYRHLTSDYLTAALPFGLQVRGCGEPRQSIPEGPVRPPAAEIDPGPWEAWPWSLLGIAPAATVAAWRDLPILVIWHFQQDPVG